MQYKEIDDDKIVVTVDGEDVEYDLMLSFQCNENGRTYIGFTDGEEDENGQLSMTFASVTSDPEDKTLYDIVYQEEEDMIEEVLQQLNINLGGNA